jgi:WD40 repeat protein
MTFPLLFFSGSKDQTVRIWDMSTWQQVAELRGHMSEVTSVAFDGSGKYLASGSGDILYASRDNNVRIWDVSTQQQVAELRGHTGPVTSVAFDGSGKYLASGEEAEA